jgi:hypothetical protein
MNVYQFQAEILCEVCAEFYMNTHDKPAQADDSDEWPQGPYTSGGGEANFPCHCGACQDFLGNPLTSDGLNWLTDELNNGEPVTGVRKEWQQFYNVELKA